MHRILRATAVAAGLSFAMATAMTVPGNAADSDVINHAAPANPPPAAPAPVSKTPAEQFETLGANAYKTGQPPRVTDPQVAALLGAVLDTRDLALSPPLPVSQIDALSERTQMLARILMIYKYAGTGYPDMASGNKAPDQAKLNGEIAQNIATYAPEVGQIYDAQLVVFGALIECFGSELWAHPDEFQDQDSRTAIIQIRTATVTLVTALFDNLLVPGLNDDWQRGRVVAVMSVAPYVAKFLLPEQRKHLHDVALSVAKRLPDPVLQAAMKGLADLFIS